MINISSQDVVALFKQKKIIEIDWSLDIISSRTIYFVSISPHSKKLLANIFMKEKPLVIIDSEIEIEGTYYCRDFFEAQKLILDLLYPLNEKLMLFGITGTNGKTTTAHFCHSLCQSIGIKSATIGTLGVRSEDYNVSMNFTTPPLIDLRKYLYEIGKNALFCFMEVSSHGIDQKRIYGLKFDNACWTSFSQDHLDYHVTLENYFEAKKKIQESLKDEAKCYFPAGNRDLARKLKTKKFIGIKDVSVFEAVDRSILLPYNISNLSLAIKMISDYVHIDNKILKKIKAPPGRLEYVKNSKCLVVIDFAHTPDALEKVCQSIRKLHPNNKMTLVFGCGGDRDKLKRPVMGRIGIKYANQLIVTSDNPRSEKPEAIMAEIVEGLEGINIKCIVDRKEAIYDALKITPDDGIIIIAGKGHEQFQIIGNKKLPFSDQEVVRNYGKS